jgi:outer membrane protein assembly factor BamB
VVGTASGRVRYDDSSRGEVVGVTNDRLFMRDAPLGDSTPIVGIDLDNDRSAGSYATNLPLRDATIADGRLVTLYGDELAAEDAGRSGHDWHTQVPVYRSPRLVPDGDLVLVTGGDGSTYAVDVADGHLVWRTVPPVAATSYDLQVTPTPRTVLTVATTNDVAHQVFVYAVDAATGRLRWARPALRVLAADRALTVLRTAHAVVAVDTDDGTLRWRHAMGGIDDAREVPRAAITRDAVVVPQVGGPALGLDRETGALIWRGAAMADVVSVGGIVVATTQEDAGVVAVRARTGAVRWSRPGLEPHQELAVTPERRVLVLDTAAVPHVVEE